MRGKFGCRYYVLQLTARGSVGLLGSRESAQVQLVVVVTPGDTVLGSHRPGPLPCASLLSCGANPRITSYSMSPPNTLQGNTAFRDPFLSLLIDSIWIPFSPFCWRYLRICGSWEAVPSLAQMLWLVFYFTHHLSKDRTRNSHSVGVSAELWQGLRLTNQMILMMVTV